METLFTAFHVIVALLIVVVVLLQPGKDGGLGALGGSTVFGPRGAVPVLGKATVVLAALFFISSMALTKINSSGTLEEDSLKKAAEAKEKESAAEAPKEAAPVQGEAPATGTSPGAAGTGGGSSSP
ncbi:MAG: hypothetical protein GMKNLPBB_02423 [Myxococcota bacterium]|nr:hypothetical protein [Myxococcota bacterium]